MTEYDLPALVAPQRAKLWLIGAMLAIAGVAYLYTEKIAQALGIPIVAIQLGALVLVLTSLVAAFVAIRCSNCGLRLVPYAMSHKGLGEWLQWLLTVKTCPKCGLPRAKDQSADS